MKLQQYYPRRYDPYSRLSCSPQVDASSRASECYTVLLIYTLLLQLRVQSFVDSCLPMRLSCSPEIGSFQKCFSSQFYLRQNQCHKNLKAYTLMFSCTSSQG